MRRQRLQASGALATPPHPGISCWQGSEATALPTASGMPEDAEAEEGELEVSHLPSMPCSLLRHLTVSAGVWAAMLSCCTEVSGRGCSLPACNRCVTSPATVVTCVPCSSAQVTVLLVRAGSSG